MPFFMGVRLKRSLSKKKQLSTVVNTFTSLVYKGEPICKYTLDRYVYGIDVDEDKQRITATDVNNDQPIIQFYFD